MNTFISAPNIRSAQYSKRPWSRLEEALHFLRINTDVPGSSCGHNDNRFHANAPLSSGLCLVLACVRYPSVHSSPTYHDRSRSSLPENPQVQLSKLKFTTTKQSRSTPTPHSPMEITVRTVFERHLAPRLGDRDSSINVDDELPEKRNESSLGEDLERGK